MATSPSMSRPASICFVSRPQAVLPIARPRAAARKPPLRRVSWPGCGTMDSGTKRCRELLTPRVANSTRRTTAAPLACRGTSAHAVDALAPPTSIDVGYYAARRSRRSGELERRSGRVEACGRGSWSRSTSQAKALMAGQSAHATSASSAAVLGENGFAMPPPGARTSVCVLKSNSKSFALSTATPTPSV